MMLERLFHLADMFDMYGMLLTEKQRRCLELHLFEDFSLAEVGEAVGVSRQAAYDMVHRSEQALEGYEEKLGLLRRLKVEHEALAAIAARIETLRTEDNAGEVDQILQRIARLLGTRREVQHDI
ncbi:YlxM family DNA-binding protein [Selenomonas sp.]|uniref:YlxM family DNA-binding protein n=1 Tax=Selenomonas sp. TaxID=2053611 RepID=UPI003FA219A7